MRTKLLRRISLSSLATRRHTIRLSLLALVGGIVSLTPLHAGVLFTFEEVGSDVVATTSGSIAEGWSSEQSGPSTQGSNQGLVGSSSIRGLLTGDNRLISEDARWTLNNTIAGFPTLIGDGTPTGDNFGFSSDNNFYFPAGTSVGDAFTPTTTITWTGRTFASMGLDIGLSTTPLTLFTLDNGSTISGALIPEPSSYGFLLGAVGLATAIFCRRRRARTD